MKHPSSIQVVNRWWGNCLGNIEEQILDATPLHKHSQYKKTLCACFSYFRKTKWTIKRHTQLHHSWGAGSCSSHISFFTYMGLETFTPFCVHWCSVEASRSREALAVTFEPHHLGPSHLQQNWQVQPGHVMITVWSSQCKDRGWWTLVPKLIDPDPYLPSREQREKEIQQKGPLWKIA